MRWRAAHVKKTAACACKVKRPKKHVNETRKNMEPFFLKNLTHGIRSHGGVESSQVYRIAPRRWVCVHLWCRRRRFAPSWRLFLTTFTLYGTFTFLITVDCLYSAISVELDRHSLAEQLLVFFLEPQFQRRFREFNHTCFWQFNAARVKRVGNAVVRLKASYWVITWMN